MNFSGDDRNSALWSQLVIPLFEGFMAGRLGEAYRPHEARASQGAHMFGRAVGNLVRPRTEAELQEAAVRASVEEQRKTNEALLMQARKDAWLEHGAWYSHDQKIARKRIIDVHLEHYACTGMLSRSSTQGMCELCDQDVVQWSDACVSHGSMPPAILIKRAYIVFTGTQVAPLSVNAHAHCVHLFRVHWEAFRPTYLNKLRARIIQVCEDDARLPRALIDHALLPYFHEFSTPDERYWSHLDSLVA
jgi:hypothetical protein